MISALKRGLAWGTVVLLLAFTLAARGQTAASEAALQQLVTEAEAGDIQAQVELGMLYVTGEGVSKNLREGAKWLRRAAEGNNAVAQSNLGVLYLRGQGVPTNPPEAFKWFRKAAGQGLAVAQVNLANLYLEGMGVRRAPQEAARWFRRAADQGDAQAQRMLGSLYVEGKGVAQDPVEAYKWWHLAAAQGDTSASQYRQELARTLTRTQLAEAKRRASAFEPRPESLSSGKSYKSGTGFFVSTSGYLITCYHVIEGAKNFTVRTKSATLPAQVVKVDKTNDIALLKVTGTFTALALTNSKSATLGDTVLALGYPNVQVQGRGLKLTRGEINSTAGMRDDPRFFQMSAAVQPGNSGGPLLDRFGNVIGLVTLRLNDMRALWDTGAVPQNVNYALKSAYVLKLLQAVPGAKTALVAPAPATSRDPGNVVAKIQNAVVIVEAR